MHARLGISFVLVLAQAMTGSAEANDITYSASIVTRVGEVAPGTGGAIFQDVNRPVLNDLGEVAFSAVLTGAGTSTTNDYAFFTEGGGGGLRLSAREGDEAPGTGGGIFNFAALPVERYDLNEQGTTVFSGQVQPAGSPAFIREPMLFADIGSGSVAIVKPGDPIDGVAGSLEYGLAFDPSLNNSGTIAFSAFFSRDGGATFEAGQFVREANGQANLVAFNGGEAPGTGGKIFTNILTANVSDSGTIVLSSTFNEPGGDFSTEGRGIFSDRDGTLSVVTRDGDVAPGTSGKTFRGFASATINSTGEVAFHGFLDDNSVPIGPGIFSEGGGGGLRTVAVEGEDAPGTDTLGFGPAMFGPQFSRTNGDRLSMNEAGDLVFTNILRGPGIFSGNNDALFVETDGVLQLLARQGDVIPGIEGFTVDGFDFEPQINNLGQVAVRTVLVDNSTFQRQVSVVVFSPQAPVPEPTALSLLFLALLAGASSCRYCRVI